MLISEVQSFEGKYTNLPDAVLETKSLNYPGI